MHSSDNRPIGSRSPQGSHSCNRKKQTWTQWGNIEFSLAGTRWVVCLVVAIKNASVTSQTPAALQSQYYKTFYLVCSSILHSLRALWIGGRHWGPVILTSARIGSPGPGRFPYSHCGWARLRPSDSDFSQNWKPGTREISLYSLWLGAIETNQTI
jgi:hypothetical protein